MSTSVCQEMQTQFIPWLDEQRIISFKLSPLISKSSLCFPKTSVCQNTDLQLNHLDAKQYNIKKTNFGNDLNQRKKCSENGDSGVWSFLQALSNTPSPNSEKEKVYVHPLHTRSASVLSEKSLEMCTESLGSETGSIISDSGDELIPSSFDTQFEKSPTMRCFTTKRERLASTVSSFPPPLTTIRGGCSGGVQVKSQRQDGRLVIKAVRVQTYQSQFEAERMGGRLRLKVRDECIDEDDELKNETDAESNGVVEEGVISSSSCKEGRSTMSEGGIINWEPICIVTS